MSGWTANIKRGESPLPSAAAPPNRRGRGGRPTKGQLAEAGALEGAEGALADVRKDNPETFAVAPRRASWEKNYDKAEKEIERAEAEAVLSARQERLSALQEQTTVLRANRQIALGFSGAALRLLTTMQATAKELDSRVRNDVEDLTIKDLQQILQVTGTTVAKAQTAVEAMVKTERYVMRHPLDDDSGPGDDLEGLDAAGAKMILENLSKSIAHISGRYSKPAAVAADVQVVEEPNDPT